MKKLVVVLFFLSSNVLSAQIAIQDATSAYHDYLKNYYSPLPNAIGSGLNNSWWSTAKTHDVLGIDVSLIIPNIFIPDEAGTFGNDNPGILFGDQIDPSLGFVYPIPEHGGTIVYNGADGKAWLMYGVLQIGVGLPKNTDLILRYSPSIEGNIILVPPIRNPGDAEYTGTGNFGLYGFGIKHDIMQWLPIADKIPMDLSLMIGYTRANFKNQRGTNLSEIYQSEHVYVINATTINLLFSKKISFFTPHIGVGIDLTSSNFTNNGSDYGYPIHGIAESQNINFNDISTIELNKQTDIKANFGARFNLTFMTINAAYTTTRYGYKLGTLGLGFSLR